MFKSEPICILKVGSTVDGREVPQQDVDDITETYNPKKYNARINDDHNKWSWKGGSVLSVEKRSAEDGDEVWAVIKPNSHLLRNIEMGQLLHTSCEYQRDFAGSGKAYLTGLAFTDEPASLGTTQVHLSARADNVILVSSGQAINSEHFSTADDDEASLFKKFTNWLKGEHSQEQLSQQEEENEMSKETEELLKQSVELNSKMNEQLGQLVEALNKKEQPEDENDPPQSEANPLEEKVEQLSAQVEELTTKLSQSTDEQQRNLAGQDAEPELYL